MQPRDKIYNRTPQNKPACVNCKHSFVEDFGDNAGRIVCKVENEFRNPEYTCNDWRCK